MMPTFRTRATTCLLLVGSWAMASAPGLGQSAAIDSPRVAALAAALADGHRAALDEFWAEMAEHGTPLVEPLDGTRVRLTFLWREHWPRQRVVVVGGPGGLVLDENQMVKLPDSDVWYRTYRVRNDLRTTYRLSPDDSLVPFAEATDMQARMAGFRRDPLNPRTFVLPADPTSPGSVESVLSVVELPAALPQAWIGEDPNAPAGDLEDHEFHSAILDNDRTLSIYTPAGYDTARVEPYPLLVLFDRGAYLRLVPTPTILDNLIAAGRIPPLVAVLVGNVNRARELPCYRPFGEFLARELVPWIRGQYTVTGDPGHVVVAGSSYGGLASSCAALWHPEIFGNVLSQSGSYWWRPEGDVEAEWLSRQVVARGDLGVQFYLDIGLLESGPTRNGGPSMLVTNRHLRDLLRATGHEVTYREINSGHDYVSWRGTLADGLIALIGQSDRLLDKEHGKNSGSSSTIAGIALRTERTTR